MDVYFGNGLIKKDIFSSLTFQNVSFTTNSIINKKNNLISYSVSNSSFFMDSINKCYIQLNNGLNISNHTYIRDSNNNTDIKLLLIIMNYK